MKFIEDSRQQKGKHEIKHQYWQSNGDKFIRCKIPFGDYCLPPKVAVDTKGNMSEIAQNLINEHNRFREECKLAKEYGCHLYFLIENEDGIKCIEDVTRWINPRLEYSAKAVKGPQLAKSMATMQERYGCTFLFCTPQESAQKILELLGVEK